MTEQFGRPYAQQYDALYEAKDYPAECDAVEGLLRRHGSGAAREILDLGCGTGTHAIELARRGYSVTGVDRSPSMLGLARDKAARATAAPRGGAPEFIAGDVRSVRVGRTFDAVLMLFAVLGYQTTDADVAAAMSTVAAHLRPGGVFVCDVWYGPAVLATGTSERRKVIDVPGGQLHRISSGRLDRAAHTCCVDFRTWRSTAEGNADESVEAHTMRYFFEPELDAFFRSAGLEPCGLCPFDDLDGLPGLDSWNIWACARALRRS